jgi:hypothetical protein
LRRIRDMSGRDSFRALLRDGSMEDRTVDVGFLI